jgi:hypothetical protein
MALVPTGPNVLGRSCEGCTKCCSGALSATIEIQSRLTVHELKPGNPCVFVQIGKGCGVYDERPEVPCKTFRCQYLVDESVPEEMKPSKSNVILTIEEVLPNVEYIIAHEAGGSLEGENLKWVSSLYDNYAVNATWKDDGRWHFKGDTIFTAKMMQLYGETIVQS